MRRQTSVEQSEAGTDDHEARKDDPRYRLMERILATPDFARSPQLSKFLFYICSAAFENHSQILSEQHIGVDVFGREPDYDSAADTIVRSHALRLRRRLEQYFQRAGRNEPIHLIVPRGGYVPIFLPAPERPAGEQQNTNFLAESVSTAVDVEKPHHDTQLPILRISADDVKRERDETSRDPRKFVVWRYRALTTILVLLFVGLAVAFGVHLRTQFHISRRHILWSRLFTDDQPTHIVLGDSGLVLFHAVTHQYVSLHDYLNDDVSKQMQFVEHVDPGFAQFLLHRRYTSAVDAMTLARLLRLPEAIPERTLVHYARDMHLDDFKSGNVIMIGAQEAVPWVELFEEHMDFAFSIDHPDKHSSFLNRHPQEGELVEYSSYTPTTRTKVYAVLAFLPNLSATGNVMILEGLSMAGTEAAVDLATDDDRLIPILTKIRRPNGSLPYFEMLLESDVLGESAGPARVVAIHRHD